MHSNTTITAMAGTALTLGIMMTVAGSAAHLQGQLSSHGSMALPLSPSTELLQGPLHTAAPLMTPVVTYQAHAQLLLGMALILGGFVLVLILKRQERYDERPVRIRVATPTATMRPRRLSRRQKVYWMQVSL